LYSISSSFAVLNDLKTEKSQTFVEIKLVKSKRHFKARSGLRPKSLRGNRIYKDYRDIAEKASHHFKNAAISLKM
jgi:hypothetical protein